MSKQTNPHEAAARWRKAARLIATLYVCKIPHELILQMSKKEWAIVAKKAEVKNPSEETIELVMDLLAKMVKERGEGCQS